MSCIAFLNRGLYILFVYQICGRRKVALVSSQFYIECVLQALVARAGRTLQSEADQFEGEINSLQSFQRQQCIEASSRTFGRR